MKHLFRILGATALLGMCMGAAQAVPTQRAEEMSPPGAVGSYDDDGEYRVPTIAWGADLATVFANGSDTETQDGSIFDQEGLSVELFREDNFRNQVEQFRRGDINFLRGTLGMVLSASEALCDDERTCPQIIYNLSRSTGGDALVARGGIQNIEDLRGKTIGLQLYGPHMRLLTEVLELGGLTPSDVTIRWYRDLDVNGSQSASLAFEAGEIDAAFVIIPDAMMYTDGDAAIDGARMLFSTRSLDSVIFDVYAVRPDFAEAHPDVVAAFTSALLRANEELAQVIDDGSGTAYDRVVRAGAELLLGEGDDPELQDIIRDMYSLDATMQGWTGNVRFLTCNVDGRRELVCLNNLRSATGTSFQSLGLLRSAAAASQVVAYQHNWTALRDGLRENFGVEAPRFDRQEVTRVAQALADTGSIDDQSIVSFAVTFGANQFDFPVDQYAADFDRALSTMARSGGALVVIEGHADPLGYLYQKYRDDLSPEIWRQTRQSARNLSLQRADALLGALEDYAESQGIRVTFDGVTTIGSGIERPLSGMCEWEYQGRTVEDPCRPANEAEWAAGRRVVFSLVNVESEVAVFDDDF